MQKSKLALLLILVLLLISGTALASDSFTSSIFSKNTHISAEQWFADDESRAMFTTLAAIELVKNIDGLNSTDVLSDYLANPSWVGLSKSKKQIMSIGYIESGKVLIALLTPETGIIEYLHMDFSSSDDSTSVATIIESIIPQIFEAQDATSDYYLNDTNAILSAVEKVYGQSDGSQSNAADDKGGSSNASAMKWETKCFDELSSYFKNPKSAQLVRSFSASCANPNYLLFLMDISAENSFGGTTTDSYFVVYETTSNKISAIAFDGVVSHVNDIADQNKMYAKYLTLKDGGGNYIANQLQIRITDFADYLKELYDSFFK